MWPLPARRLDRGGPGESERGWEGGATPGGGGRKEERRGGVVAAGRREAVGDA